MNSRFVKSTDKLLITAEWCPHPLEKNTNLVRSIVKKVPTDAKNTDETVVILMDKSFSMESVIKDMREKTKYG